MRLTLVYAARFHVWNGCTFVQPAYGKYVDSLAERVEELVLCGPVSDQPVEGSGYELRARHHRVVPLPYYERDVDGARVLHASLRGLHCALDGASLASIMLPLGLLGPAAYWIAFRRKVPLFLHVVGDLAAQWDPRGYTFPTRLVASLAVAGLEVVHRRMIAETFTFVQGKGLLHQYGGPRPRMVEAMETTIADGDVRSAGRQWESKSEVRLLFAGNLIRPKGVAVLLEALSLLSKSSRYRLVIAGTGPMESELRSRTSTLGLDDHVDFVGFQTLPQVLKLMDEADVFVFPSFGEGMPRVILEAMARGLPIVATDVGGIFGVVRHGENGLLVPPGSAAALAQSITRLLGDPILWEHFSAQGIRTAREHTMDHYADIMVSELRRVGLWQP